jgi:hypothetical protein
VSKHRNKSHQNQSKTNDHDEPACHENVKRPAIYPVAIEFSPADAKKYARDHLYQQSQIRISCWLNVITAAAAGVGLFGLFYLHGQLNVMQQQLSDARATQIARLTVEMPNPTVTTEKDGAMMADGYIVVKNAGNTPALEPHVKYGTGSSIKFPRGKENIDIASVPGNSPLSASLPIQIRYIDFVGYDETKRPDQKRFFFYDIQVAYKDVFGTSYAFSERFVFEPNHGVFYRTE